MTKLKLAILGSTRGTNMQAIIDAILAKCIYASIDIVISNKENAYILKKAANYNITNKFISSKGLDRKNYDIRLINEINKFNPDLILLIGFMRILSPIFIDSFKNRILNIHPSLLPKYGGLMDLDVHQSVIDSGDSVSGCTVHKVTDEVDSGDIILQLMCDVNGNETSEILKAKIQDLEGKAWVEVIKNWKK